MFEVGKEYVWAKEPKNPIIVLAVSPTDSSRLYAEYKYTGRSATLYQDQFGAYQEYVAPVVLEYWFNIYPTRISLGHKSRAEADKAASSARIGCKKVVFTEGKFDN